MPGLKVKELIELLKQFDSERPVYMMDWDHPCPLTVGDVYDTTLTDENGRNRFQVILFGP